MFPNMQIIRTQILHSQSSSPCRRHFPAQRYSGRTGDKERSANSPFRQWQASANRRFGYSIPSTRLFPCLHVLLSLCFPCSKNLSRQRGRKRLRDKGKEKSNIKNLDYERHSTIKRVPTRERVGNGSEQLHLRPEKVCGGNPVDAPDAPAEPLQAAQGVYQGYG